MNKNRQTRTILFIGLQYITAIVVMVCFTAERSLATEFLINVLFYIIIFIIPILLFIKKTQKGNVLSYLNLRYNLKGIITGFVIAFFMALIFFISNKFKLKILSFDTTGLLMLTGMVLAGLFEEIVFRGFYLKFFDNKLGFVWANIITALLFSLLHIKHILQLNIIQLAMLFILGLFLGYVCKKTKSLWAPIIIHAAFNVLIFLFQ